MSFSLLDLNTKLQKKITELGYENFTPVQKQAIPVILEKKDVLGIAPTGSGKTASFVLPILSLLEKEKESYKNRHVQALILLPTRELAMQVLEVVQNFAGFESDKIKSLAVHGGVSINPQMKNLIGVSLLVATPGRLLELIDSKAVYLDQCQIFVLDEADKMLNEGFKEEMERIIHLLPKNRQNLLFSATLNEDVQAITQILLKDPLLIKIEREEEKKDLIEQTAYFVSEERKGPFLRYLIKTKEMQQVLVFTSSIFKAEMLVEKLKKNGIHAMATHSKKSQEARNKALSAFKNGNLKVLVATDLISRGIDISVLPYVVNYELPRSPKDYVHRIGRTGRAGTCGIAYTLVTPEDEHHFKIIQKKTKENILIEQTETIELRGF